MVPIVTPPELTVDEESYKEWEDRPINIYFRGKNRSCHNPRAQLNRNLTFNLLGRAPGVIVSNNHAASPDAYFQELRDSKFCLVLACDDPQTSRFSDALAAGCIPIVINDHFRLHVAPFVRLMNYDAMIVTIAEADWQASGGTYLPSPVLLRSGENARALRDLHDGMMEMRRALLWHHPHSLVATMALRTVQHECLSSHTRDAGLGLQPV
ncbi:unnamed protein product [Phaeothamnion confervicola]